MNVNFVLYNSDSINYIRKFFKNLFNIFLDNSILINKQYIYPLILLRIFHLFWSQSLSSDEKRKLLNKVRKENEICGKDFIFLESSFLSEPKLTELDKKILPFLGCRGGRTYCAILANGDVVGCKMLPFIVAGNIYKKDFKEIWQEDKNWKIWRNDKLSKRCNLCKYGKACRGGCKAISFHEYENFDIPDPRCMGPFT